MPCWSTSTAPRTERPRPGASSALRSAGGQRARITRRAPPALSVAVERLYGAFSGYRMPPVTDYCTHCVSADDEAALHRHPLRELPAAAVTSFAANSSMTQGGLHDVKHLLPRLLELVALAAFDGFPDIETVVGVLARGTWETWPGDERAAVRSFLLAWWTDELAGWPARHDTESVLSAIATAEDDLTPYLAIWEDAADPAAALHFAELVAGDATRLTAGDLLGNPWLVARTAQNAQVSGWLRAAFPDFGPRLRAAADRCAPADDRAHEVLTTALTVLTA